MAQQQSSSPFALSSSQGQKTLTEDHQLGDSWIEMEQPTELSTSGRVTPIPFSAGGGEEYLRLLREAQRESKESSRVVSLAGSRRDSPRSSPKSPPNSPNNELSTDNDLKGIFINYYNAWNENEPIAATKSGKDFDWNSRPDQKPPKEWKLPDSRLNQGYSIRLAKVGKFSLFSKEVFYSLLISNFLSLVIGTGVGIWLTKRGIMLAKISIE